jgi:hypothetical protein
MLFVIFLLIDSIKYGRIPKTAKEHASVLQGPFVFAIISRTYKKSSLSLSVWVNNQVEPASVQPTQKLLQESGNNRFHKSGDIILTLNMVKRHIT